MTLRIDKYKMMTIVAFILSLVSAVMTALGMSDLFQRGGIIIFLIFVCIDLGRFLLFNFLTDEWKNLRSIKYVITIILALLFGYSAVGIFSQLNNMISPATRQAMLNAASFNKAASNALIKQNRTTDLATMAKKEYEEALIWNKNDFENCIKRAQKSEDIDKAENKCNNTKRTLDNKASKTYKEAVAKADESLDKVETTTKEVSQNQSDLAAIVTSICMIGRMDCGSYSGLQNALSIIILLVIVGTDYLQIAIVLAVNTRKNKKQLVEDEPLKKDVIDDINKETKIEVDENELYNEGNNKTVDKKASVKKKTSIKKDKVKTTKKLSKSKKKVLIPDEKIVELESEKKEIQGENFTIEMSEAQKEAVNKLKDKIKEKQSALDQAFLSAKDNIKNDSKNNGKAQFHVSEETDFLI